MLFGDRWLVGTDGMIRCLKCNSRSWAKYHRCWIYTDHRAGYYEDAYAPDFVLMLSEIRFSIWIQSMDSIYDKA